VIGVYIYVNIFIIILIFAISVLFSIIFYRTRFFSLIFILISLLFIGVILADLSLNHISKHDIFKFADGETHIVEGKVISDIQSNKRNLTFFFQPTKLYYKGKIIKVSGRIRMKVYGEYHKAINYGSYLKIKPRLVQPKPERYKGGFNYRRWLLIRNTRTLGYAGIDDVEIIDQTISNPFLYFAFKLKDYLNDELKTILRGDEGSIIRGITLGVREEIPDKIEEEFNIAGVTHILAISGQNLSLITFVIFLLITSVGFSRRTASLICIPFVVFYSILTGFDPPVVRAMIMALVVLMAIVLKRDYELLNVIGFSFFVFVMFNPLIIYDVGFQLSFSAVIGIALFYNYIYKLMSFIPALIRETFSATASAQIGVIPILMYNFYGFSVVGLFSNLIIVPLSSILMTASFIGTIFMLLHYNTAIILLKISEFLAWITIILTRLFSKIPFAKIYTGRPFLFYVVFYLVSLFVIGFYLLYKKKNTRLTFILGLILIIIPLYYSLIISDGDNRLTITIFDVGDADSTVVETPSGDVYIIDGGELTRTWDTGKSVIAPYLHSKGIGEIDAMINTHPHNDHLGGLIYLMENFNVKDYYDIGVPYSTWTYQEMINTLRTSGVMYHRIYPHLVLSDNPVLISFLTPNYYYPQRLSIPDVRGEDLNLVSSIIYLKYGYFNGLLTADNTTLEYNLNVLSKKQLSMLKVPHQGSKHKGQDEYVSFLEPEVAVINCGYNPYIYDEVTRQLYEENGALTILTREKGCITIETDGREMTVKTMY
jgi:competence protein ComEC